MGLLLLLLLIAAKCPKLSLGLWLSAKDAGLRRLAKYRWF